MSYYSGHRPWSIEAAVKLLDMGGGRKDFQQLGHEQLKAAVALHRMLLKQGCGYLADEVGMGKTYVALAVVALFRHINPRFRVLYLAPSRNVMEKWHGRELPAFLRENVRRSSMIENRESNDYYSGVSCGSVDEWVSHVRERPSAADTFLSFTALSFPLTGDKDNWQARVRSLAERADVASSLTGIEKKDTFKQRAAEIVRSILPRYDLLVIDEAHLLKNDASDRAHFLSSVLGGGGHGRAKIRGALLLSGTPYDRDLTQLSRQLKMVSLSNGRNSPYQKVEELSQKRADGCDWSVVHDGLKSLMVRRVQVLEVGDQLLSRNQYRIESRAAAGITLTSDDPKTLQQRLFTAMVQKRLMEHLDKNNAGRFPMAMFSSWEAYSSGNAAGHAREVVQDGVAMTMGDAMDSDDRASPPENALDSNMMKNIVESHEAVFHSPPPHPKLDHEVNRIANEALQMGEKQLVFVRRLKSVDDLFSRLNQAYDEWLSEYLEARGLLTADEWRRQSLKIRKESKGGLNDSGELARGEGGLEGGENDPEADISVPASRETLFSWFFRGELTKEGERFAAEHGLPLPSLLRERLRDPERAESLIAEFDWKALLERDGRLNCRVALEEIVAEASSDGVKCMPTRLSRYRRLQMAWARCAARKASYPQNEVLEYIAKSLSILIESGRSGSSLDVISVSAARQLLDSPTLYTGLASAGLMPDVIPEWERIFDFLEVSDELVALRFLQRLDLHRELIFATLRLNHPFIDLYSCWASSKSRESAAQVAAELVEVVVRSVADGGWQLGTGGILRLLADAFDQVVKTNFAHLVEVGGHVKRSSWRRYIQQQLTPFSPIEWASGQKSAEHRGPIARRFRMPGYPLVLIATSVFQEGEDLHVCCDRVTHFGISGSPIGIEQKNGRVDRIGSLAHRRLQRLKSVQEAGIRVHFPHLTESMEWYQIRDLAASLNENLRSMHKLGGSAGAEAPLLGDVIADRSPIPDQLSERLYSPFEPDICDDDGCVMPHEL